MVHLMQFAIRPALLYTLLGFVHQFDCMIPISREGIKADPAGNVAPQWQWHEVPAIPEAHASAGIVAPQWQWQEIPVIPAARSSADNVGYPRHMGHYPHYNDHSVLLTQHQSAGYYNLLHPMNAFNHLSPTSVPPASMFIPLGPQHRHHLLPRMQSNKRAAESQVIGSFGPEIKRKMLDAAPFVPGRASLVKQDDIDKQGVESQVVPKDQEALIRQSSNQINEGGQTRDHVEEVAEPEVSRVHLETKSSPKVTKLKSFDYAMDPDHFRKLQDAIFSQYSNAKSKTPAVDHGLPQSVGSRGLNEAQQESLGPTIEQNSDPDKSSTSSISESSSLSESNIPSHKSPSIQNSNNEGRGVKDDQEITPDHRLDSGHTGFIDTSETPQPPEKEREALSPTYHIDFPSLASSSERNGAGRQGLGNPEALHDSDQTAPITRLHHPSEESDSQPNPKPTISFTPRRKGAQAKKSTSNTSSKTSGQLKKTSLQNLLDASAILDQRDEEAIEKTRILLEIAERKSVTPTTKTTVKSATRRVDQKLLTQKEVPKKETDEQVKRLMVEDPSNSETESPKETPKSSAPISIEDSKEIKLTEEASQLEDKIVPQKSSTPLKSISIPSEATHNTEHTSEVATAPKEAVISSHLAQSRVSQHPRVTQEKSKTASLPPEEKQPSTTDSVSLPGVQTTGSGEVKLDGGYQAGTPPEFLDDQVRKTFEAKHHQPNLKKEIKTSGILKEISQTPEQILDIPHSPDQLEYHTGSKSDRIKSITTSPTPKLDTTSATLRTPFSEAKSIPVTISRPVEGSSDIKHTTISEQAPRRISKHIESLEDKPRRTKPPQDLELQESSSTISPSNRNRFPPYLVTGDDRHKINARAIISLESAFGSRYGGTNKRFLGELSSEKNGKDVFNSAAMRLLRRYLLVNNRQNYAALEFLTSQDYEKLLLAWKRDNSVYKRAESHVRDTIGIFEGTRRIVTLRRQILRFSIAKKWLGINEKGFAASTDGLSSTELMCGVSVDPLLVREIPLSESLSKSKKKKWDDHAVYALFWGEAELERQLEMRAYLAQRTNPSNWWQDEVDEEIRVFGFDILTILKVGDSLQFGCNFLLGWGSGRMSIDSAFAQLIQVMTDTNRPLPWIESSERAWLYNFHHGMYKERIHDLSQLISKSGPEKNPLSARILSEQVSPAFVKDNQRRMGEVLIWIDEGRGWDELSELMKARKLVSRPFLAEGLSRRHAWEFLDILVTNAKFFWKRFQDAAGIEVVF
ncbi:hypothetical protein PCASD_25497 [Puccinia coronata f. sp. avenae]|uniref:Uncharacterized protein n=1 Tax=Puccinia coronata f. sp. avenae TaxID=200324 RepID=A0A2N5SF89_9BASI|nr:hypothetical protein PCASD_25497 [Puccinia coronata f. sp. avenae]